MTIDSLVSSGNHASSVNDCQSAQDIPAEENKPVVSGILGRYFSACKLDRLSSLLPTDSYTGNPKKLSVFGASILLRAVSAIMPQTGWIGPAISLGTSIASSAGLMYLGGIRELKEEASPMPEEKIREVVDQNISDIKAEGSVPLFQRTVTTPDGHHYSLLWAQTTEQQTHSEAHSEAHSEDSLVLCQLLLDKSNKEVLGGLASFLAEQEPLPGMSEYTKYQAFIETLEERGDFLRIDQPVNWLRNVIADILKQYDITDVKQLLYIILNRAADDEQYDRAMQLLTCYKRHPLQNDEAKSLLQQCPDLPVSENSAYQCVGILERVFAGEAEARIQSDSNRTTGSIKGSSGFATTVFGGLSLFSLFSSAYGDRKITQLRGKGKNYDKTAIEYGCASNRISNYPDLNTEFCKEVCIDVDFGGGMHRNTIGEFRCNQARKVMNKVFWKERAEDSYHCRFQANELKTSSFNCLIRYAREIYGCNQKQPSHTWCALCNASRDERYHCVKFPSRLTRMWDSRNKEKVPIYDICNYANTEVSKHAYQDVCSNYCIDNFSAIGKENNGLQIPSWWEDIGRLRSARAKEAIDKIIPRIEARDQYNCQLFLDLNAAIDSESSGCINDYLNAKCQELKGSGGSDNTCRVCDTSKNPALHCNELPQFVTEVTLDDKRYSLSTVCDYSDRGLSNIGYSNVCRAYCINNFAAKDNSPGFSVDPQWSFVGQQRCESAASAIVQAVDVGELNEAGCEVQWDSKAFIDISKLDCLKNYLDMECQKLKDLKGAGQNIDTQSALCDLCDASFNQELHCRALPKSITLIGSHPIGSLCDYTVPDLSRGAYSSVCASYCLNNTVSGRQDYYPEVTPSWWGTIGERRCENSAYAISKILDPNDFGTRTGCSVTWGGGVAEIEQSAGSLQCIQGYLQNQCTELVSRASRTTGPLGDKDSLLGYVCDSASDHALHIHPLPQYVTQIDSFPLSSVCSDKKLFLESGAVPVVCKHFCIGNEASDFLPLQSWWNADRCAAAENAVGDVVNTQTANQAYACGAEWDSAATIKLEKVNCLKSYFDTECRKLVAVPTQAGSSKLSMICDAAANPELHINKLPTTTPPAATTPATTTTTPAATTPATTPAPAPAPSGLSTSTYIAGGGAMAGLAILGYAGYHWYQGRKEGDENWLSRPIRRLCGRREQTLSQTLSGGVDESRSEGIELQSKAESPAATGSSAFVPRADPTNEALSLMAFNLSIMQQMHLQHMQRSMLMDQGGATNVALPALPAFPALPALPALPAIEYLPAPDSDSPSQPFLVLAEGSGSAVTDEASTSAGAGEKDKKDRSRASEKYTAVQSSASAGAGEQDKTDRSRAAEKNTAVQSSASAEAGEQDKTDRSRAAEKNTAVQSSASAEAGEKDKTGRSRASEKDTAVQSSASAGAREKDKTGRSRASEKDTAVQSSASAGAREKDKTGRSHTTKTSRSVLDSRLQDIRPERKRVDERYRVGSVRYGTERTSTGKR